MTGSTAGAGSGEFHNYSLHKQRERSRLAAMDYEARQVLSHFAIKIYLQNVLSPISKGIKKEEIWRKK